MDTVFDSKEKQEQIRRELRDLMWDNPTSMLQWAKEIGINDRSLDKFVKGGDIRWTTLAVIDKYLRLRNKNN